MFPSNGRVLKFWRNRRVDVLRDVSETHPCALRSGNLTLNAYLWGDRTVISQLVYSLGGSGFAGANGSMMIEVVVSACLKENHRKKEFSKFNTAFLPHPCSFDNKRAR